MLTSKLEQLEGEDKITVSGAHTFGSLIKAYGHTRDIGGAWRCWKEMRSRHIKQTSITIGCMVEAVVTNGDPDGGYELIQQLMADEQCRDQVNAVIYCSVLKGYARSRRMERVWTIFNEMLSCGIEPSVITFNAVIDACARNSRMDAVPRLMSDMKARGLEPNLITYSTMLKGFCQRGDVRAAFAILEEMKQDTKMKPDEIMYNTLIDGCAQNNLLAEGERLLHQMQDEGIQPSNYTLTVVAKLFGNARRVDQAFELVEGLAKRHNLRPNAHVYANLVQACITARDLPRAMKVFDQMLSERMQIDSRTWQALTRAHQQSQQYPQVVSIMNTVVRNQMVLTNSDAEFVSNALRSIADMGIDCSGEAGLLAGKVRAYR
jgi:pentatricopeptide repeat protein